MWSLLRALVRSARAAAAVLFLATASFGLTEATGVTRVVQSTVIRLFHRDGTLVVEVDDPELKIRIDGEELIVEGAGPKEIRQKPGQYKVQANEDGKVVRQELVTVTKGDRRVVRISLGWCSARLAGGA